MEEVMNRLSKQCIVAVLACVGFISLLGITGTYEYADEVVYNMPEHVYYTILDTIDDPSNKAVAAEYMNNREYYDNLKY